MLIFLMQNQDSQYSFMILFCALFSFCALKFIGSQKLNSTQNLKLEIHFCGISILWAGFFNI